MWSTRGRFAPGQPYELAVAAGTLRDDPDREMVGDDLYEVWRVRAHSRRRGQRARRTDTARQGELCALQCDERAHGRRLVRHRRQAAAPDQAQFARRLCEVTDL